MQRGLRFDDRIPSGQGKGFAVMCGICGAVWSDPGLRWRHDSLTAMMDQIAHRGPDDAGMYRDEHAALGFRRLAILDLPGGHQPLANETGHDLDGFQWRDRTALPLASMLQWRYHQVSSRHTQLGSSPRTGRHVCHRGHVW